MKKKSNKAQTLWQKAKLKFDEDRIDEMRSNLKLPSHAVGVSILKQWPTGSSSEIVAQLNLLIEFVREVAAMSNYVAIGFSGAIEEYILTGDVKDNTLKKSDTTGCALNFVGSDEATSELPMGFYLSLGAHSSPTDAKNFLLKRAKFIKEGRKLMYGGESIRPKTANFIRNETILWLWSMELSDLQNYATETFKVEYSHLSRRDDLISNIFNKLGVKINAATVRKTASREQNK